MLVLFLKLIAAGFAIGFKLLLVAVKLPLFYFAGRSRGCPKRFAGKCLVGRCPASPRRRVRRAPSSREQAGRLPSRGGVAAGGALAGGCAVPMVQEGLKAPRAGCSWV